jgi:hypothetical protein
MPRSTSNNGSMRRTVSSAIGEIGEPAECRQRPEGAGWDVHAADPARRNRPPPAAQSHQTVGRSGRKGQSSQVKCILLQIRAVYVLCIFFKDMNLPNPVIRSHYGNGFIKQYVRDHLILRTEPASNNVHDYGVNKSIQNLPALRNA